MVKWHFHLSRGSCLQARSILLCQLVHRDLEPFLYFSVVGFGRLGSFLPISGFFRVPSEWMDGMALFSSFYPPPLPPPLIH